MIITYEECIISKQTIADAFNMCIVNPSLRAGICCRSIQQLQSLEEDINCVISSCPPWYIDARRTRRSSNRHSETIQFDNGSILEFFVASESARGLRFHYLRADENIDEAIRFDVLPHLIRDYQFSHTNIEPECADLLEFAKSVLNTPLHHWQSEMLINLYNGRPFSTGRSLGRQTISKIYADWAQLAIQGNCCDCEYTYDEVMAGIQPPTA